MKFLNVTFFRHGTCCCENQKKVGDSVLSDSIETGKVGGNGLGIDGAGDGIKFIGVDIIVGIAGSRLGDSDGLGEGGSVISRNKPL